jgi:hypothetical protein
MYDDDSRYVYNFISGRTLWYLYRITLSFLRKGLEMENHGPAIINMVFGLIGLGTNTFTEKQRKAYLQNTETLYKRLYTVLASQDRAGADSPGEAPAAVLVFSGKNTADAINEWVLFHESSLLHDSGDPNLEALAGHIAAAYGINPEDTERLHQRITHNTAELYTFSNDMQRLDYLIGILEDEQRGSVRPENAGAAPLNRLRSIRDAYAALRDEGLRLMIKNTG